MITVSSPTAKGKMFGEPRVYFHCESLDDDAPRQQLADLLARAYMLHLSSDIIAHGYGSQVEHLIELPLPVHRLIMKSI